MSVIVPSSPKVPPCGRQKGTVAGSRPVAPLGLMRYCLLTALIAALAASLTVSVPETSAATTVTFYVDGKLGRDSYDGRSPATPFKTIAKAALSTPTGAAAAGTTVVVRGYWDYIYRERPIPPGWNRQGTAAAPIVFKADGYWPGTSRPYVKPIVSGADAAPAAGQAWSATSKPGVWRTPWATGPFGFGLSPSATIKSAIFQDTTVWLWEQPSLDALATRATAGLGGYWYDAAESQLYVSAASTSGSVAGTDPAPHRIEVITRNAFYFDGRQGVRYVQVRGFDVRHSANGIALALGTDYATVADNRLIGNLYMGIATSGLETASGPDPSTGHTIWRNTASYNTVQAIKLGEGTTATSVCDNVAYANALQGIKVEGPAGGRAYTGTTNDITLCRNKLYRNSFNPTGSAYNNASGLTIANGATNVRVLENQMWSNDVGILITQESQGLPPVDRITIKSNRISFNRRFGIYFLDGLKGQGNGRVDASYDLIYSNGIGVRIDRGSSRKTLFHETIHGNVGEGVKVGGFQVAPASLSIAESLISANGGFGVWVVTGNTTTIRYTGVSANVRGSVTGPVTSTAVNTKPAGYLTMDSRHVDYLRISPSSFQYSAGPSGGPIGARF